MMRNVGQHFAPTARYPLPGLCPLQRRQLSDFAQVLPWQRPVSRQLTFQIDRSRVVAEPTTMVIGTAAAERRRYCAPLASSFQMGQRPRKTCVQTSTAIGSWLHPVFPIVMLSYNFQDWIWAKREECTSQTLTPVTHSGNAPLAPLRRLL